MKYLKRTFHLCLCLVLILGLAYLTHTTVSAAPDGTGFLVYDEDQAVNTTPHYRTWSGTDLSAEGQLGDEETAGEESNHTIIRAAPGRDEYIRGALTSSGHLDIQIWNGTAWINGSNAPTDGEFTKLIGTTNDAQRGFDIAYESLSGDAIVVYESTSTANRSIMYRTWDGTAWSAEQTLDYTAVAEGGATDTVPWIELEADDATDNILLGWQNRTGLGFYGANWTGTAWQHIELINGAGVSAVRQGFDIAWEGTSGDGMLAYFTGTTTGFSNYNTSSGWTAGTGMVNPAGAGVWMRLDGSPTSDYIAVIMQVVLSTTTSDLFVDMWNGSDWTTISTPTADSDTNTYGFSSSVDVAWENGGSDQAVFIWRDGTTSETSLRWMTFDISAGQFQAPCTSSSQVTSLISAQGAGGPCSNLGTWSGTVGGVVLKTMRGGENMVLLAQNETILDIKPEMQFWTGSTNTWLTQTTDMGAFESDGSTGALPTSALPTRPYDFAFMRAEYITVSGAVYNAASTTQLTECDGATGMISVRTNGVTATAASCADATGVWTKSVIKPLNAGSVIVVWITGLTPNGAIVIRYDGTGDSTNNNFPASSLSVTSDDTNPVTNALLDTYDDANNSSNGDIPFSVTSNALTVNSGSKLMITLKSGVANGSTVYDPGGAVTTNTTGGDLHLDDNAFAYLDTTSTIGRDILVDAGATLYIDASTTVAGGDIATTGSGGITTSTGTPTVTLSGSGTLGGGSSTLNFYNLSMASTGTTTLNSPLTVSNTFTNGNGTNAHTFDNETNDKAMDLNGSFVNAANGTFSASSTGTFTVAGSWTNSGTVNEGTGTITLDSATAANLNSGCATPSSCTNENFYNLTLSKSVVGDTVTLTSTGLRVLNNLTVTTGTLQQGALNVQVGGSTVGSSGGVTVGASGVWSGISTGDLALGGTFSNAGTVTLRASDACGNTDTILITSTSSGTQRAWSGAGTFNFADVSVQDQAGAAAITVTSGTNVSNVGANWTFSSICPTTSSSTTATAYGFQRKTFYDVTNTKHWRFLYDGSEIDIQYTSDNGSNWTAITSLAYNTNDFSVWNAKIGATEYVWLAVASNNDIIVRQGTLSTTSITWDADASVALNGTGSSDTYAFASVSLDTSNYVWIAARHFDGSTYSFNTAATHQGTGAQTGDSDPSTWTWNSAPFELLTGQASSNVYGSLVPLASQSMYATFVRATELRGCRWDVADVQWESSGSMLCGSGGGSLTLGTPVKIDDAGNPGSMSGTGKQIVKTANGVLYSFINDGGSCELWSSIDGITWTEQDSANNPTCNSGADISIAVDGNDALHLIYTITAVNYEMRWVTFVTSTNTFSTSEVVESNFDSCNANHVAIDSNNIPHLIYFCGFATNMSYSNRVTGSWKTPLSVGLVAINYSMTINEDNIPEIVAVSSGGSQTLSAFVGNVNNATSFTEYQVDSDVFNNTGKMHTSIAIDSAGNTWVAYVDETTSYITIAKHNDADAWSTWQAPVTNSNAGVSPKLAIDGTDIYVFYEDENNDLKIDMYNGSWLGETNVVTGTFQDVKPFWQSYNFNFGSKQFEFIYNDGTDVYYNNLTFSSANWFNSNWSYRKELTIDVSKVSGGSNLTNFPVYISRTDADLAAEALDSGNDIVFTSADGTTQLSHEIEEFDGATGELVAWLRVPTVSGTVDTDIYMYYGNSTSFNQRTTAGVWNSTTAGVWHMNNDPSGTAPQLQDSSNGDNNGTSAGSMISGDLTAGPVNNSINFDGTNDYINIPMSNRFKNTSAFTVSAWIYMDNTASNYQHVVSTYDYDDALNEHGFIFGRHFGGLGLRIFRGGQNNYISLSSLPSGSAWHHVAATFVSGGSVKIFIDGVEGAVNISDSSGSPVYTVTYDYLAVGSDEPGFKIAARGDNNEAFFDGKIDEVRIFNTNLSSGWIGTEYNNQNSPSTFFSTVGVEEENGASDEIDTINSDLTKTLSVVSDTTNYDVHLLYIDDEATDQVSYKRWNNSATPSWDIGAVNLDASATDAHVALSRESNSGDLYAFWIDTSNGTIYYRNCDVSAATSECSASGDWASETAWKTGENSYITTSYAEPNQILGLWSDSEGASQTIMWDRIVSAVASTFTQNDFEWFVTANSVTLSNAWPPGNGENLAENAIFTQIPASNESLKTGDKIRIQLSVSVGDSAVSAATQAFKLQYASGEDCTTAVGWVDVGAKSSGSIWRLFDEAGLSDSTAQVNQISTSDTGVEGYYSEVNPSSTNPNLIAIGANTEWDWPVEHNGASDNTTYCFRMLKSDGNVFDVYNADGYPKLTTNPGTEQLLRHGNFFQNGTERGFLWSD
ncbi:MAG: DUF2341 domain-containing protein [bacterium]|nr:DUF2341 domain-containing protein [bacterium]